MSDTPDHEHCQAARTEPSPLTPLAAFSECLTIIDSAEPQHRKAILDALGSIKLDDVVTAGAIDWETRARNRKLRIEELQVELDAALADLADYQAEEESDFEGVEPDDDASTVTITEVPEQPSGPLCVHGRTGICPHCPARSS